MKTILLFAVLFYGKVQGQGIKELPLTTVKAEDKESFLRLVDTVQKDKSIRGTIMFKGYKASIVEDSDIKTAIGKFIKIEWMNQNDFYTYTAIFHSKLGYMTRTYFNAIVDKDYKVDDNKYCGNNYCTELRNDKRFPYILKYLQPDSEIREIK